MKPKVTKPDQQSQPKKLYQPPRAVKSEHKEFMMKVGLKLQELRKDKNISISFLARELGISRNAYSQLEKGHVYSNFWNLMCVLDYFNCSAEIFFKNL
jgi:DNA-binding XRE family transcriptional regulator